MRHVEMIERQIVIENGETESATERSICGICCYRDDHGEPQSAAWPCDYVRISRECYIQIPTGGPTSLTGYLCLLCGWDVSPYDVLDAHEPSCALYEAPPSEPTP